MTPESKFSELGRRCRTLAAAVLDALAERIEPGRRPSSNPADYPPDHPGWQRLRAALDGLDLDEPVPYWPTTAVSSIRATIDADSGEVEVDPRAHAAYWDALLDREVGPRPTFVPPAWSAPLYDQDHEFGGEA